MKLRAIGLVSLVLLALVIVLAFRLRTILSPQPGRARFIPTLSIPRVSMAANGNQSNGHSYSPSISADGRFVVFCSDATNLVEGDTNDARDVFVHDRQRDQTSRVSTASDGTQANNSSFPASVSGDGRYVAFSSLASNLVDGDTNGSWDVFVHDRQTGHTTRVSVAFDGGQGNRNSYDPAISADGRFVAFYSFADNLALRDTNGTADVFVHDRTSGQTLLASRDARSTPGDRISLNPSISADGRFVAFQSQASNLTNGDTNATWDIFVHALDTGETTRVSVGADGKEQLGGSYAPSISADARYVAFYSDATPSDDGALDVFVHDRQTGRTTPLLVSTTAETYSPSISSDGRYLALGFDVIALNAERGPVAEVLVCDRQKSANPCVSVVSGRVRGNGDSHRPCLSADGRFVAFQSLASNLTPSDTNNVWDIFVYDRGEGQATLSSIIPTAGGQLTAWPYRTSLFFPPASFTTTVIVAYSGFFPDRFALPTDLTGIGHSFILTATQAQTGQRLQPVRPYSVTLQYVPPAPAIEVRLGLYYWDAGRWIREASSRLDVRSDTVTAAPRRLARWAVLAGRPNLFLPIVWRPPISR